MRPFVLVTIVVCFLVWLATKVGVDREEEAVSIVVEEAQSTTHQPQIPEAWIGERSESTALESSEPPRSVSAPIDTQQTDELAKILRRVADREVPAPSRPYAGWSEAQLVQERLRARNAARDRLSALVESTGG